MKKIAAMKAHGAGKFSVTHYHISEPYADREMDAQQVINSPVFVMYTATFLSLYCVPYLDITLAIRLPF